MRPVVILTRTSVIPHLNAVTVAPITHTIRGIETEVPIRIGSASNKPSVIKLDAITTLEISAFVGFLERLDGETMTEVFGAIHAAFDMPF